MNVLHTYIRMCECKECDIASGQSITVGVSSSPAAIDVYMLYRLHCGTQTHDLYGTLELDWLSSLTLTHIIDVRTTHLALGT